MSSDNTSSDQTPYSTGWNQGHYNQPRPQSQQPGQSYDDLVNQQKGWDANRNGG